MRDGSGLLGEEIEAGFLPAQVPESNRKAESDENDKNLSNAPVTWLLFIVEEIVEIRSGRGVGVDAESGALAGLARCWIAEAKE